MLHKELSFLFSKRVGELVFILTLLVGITKVRLSASFLEEFGAGHLLTTQFHVERWADFAERHGLHLDS